MTGYTAVVVGNPKPRSRTLRAACLLAQELTGPVDPAYVLDVVDLGEALLRADDPVVAAAVDMVGGASLLIAASPTYKATYSGLLKVFLDHVPTGRLGGVVGIACMVGGGAGHSLAAELHLQPVLLELGATCPARAVYVLESAVGTEGCFDDWLRTSRAQLAAALR